MKGWLDNYNDSKASAPEGFQGDGFSNVGRNYSPAWGGQFQLGGNVHIAQNGNINYKYTGSSKPYELSDLGQEALDAAIFASGRRVPFGIGSAIGVSQSLSKGKLPSASDAVGLVPTLPAQLGSLMLLEAEKEKELMQEFAAKKNRGKKLSELSPKKETNETSVDETNVKKPNIPNVVTKPKKKVEKQPTPVVANKKQPAPVVKKVNPKIKALDLPEPAGPVTFPLQLPKAQTGMGNIFGNMMGGKNTSQYEMYGDDQAGGLNTFNPHYTRAGKSQPLVPGEAIASRPYSNYRPVTDTPFNFNPQAISIRDRQFLGEMPMYDMSWIDRPGFGDIYDVETRYTDWPNDSRFNISPFGLPDPAGPKTFTQLPSAELPRLRQSETKDGKQSWNIQQKNTRMKGKGGSYDDMDVNTTDPEQVKRALKKAEEYNTYVKKKYGNSKNPKALDRLNTLRNDVEITPQYEIGGSVNKAEDGIETTTQETTIFPDGKAFLRKLKTEAAAKKKNVPIRETPTPTVRDATATKKVRVDKPVKKYEPEDMYDPSISEQVRNQISYAKYKDDPKQNFGIIDKDNNVMYYVTPNGDIIGHENIITGATNKDKENAPSMLEYGKTPNEYYDYLKNTNQRVTPAGSFTLYSNKNNSYGQPHSLWDRALGALPFVDDVRLNTLDDPSFLHAMYNEMPWREEEKKEYYDHRKETYGPTGNLFRMVSEYGVPSSKGIHGTGNPNRITALNTPSANKNLSNGCINVGGKTMCFDMLKDRSKLYILPEEKDKFGEKQDHVEHKTVKYKPFGHYDDNRNWVEEEDDKLSREDLRKGRTTRAKIADIIKKNKIDASPEEIDFTAAVAQKETKGGESWLSLAESTLPGFSSYGLYEQQKSFPYLKGKSPNDDAAATQAVIDFYRDMRYHHPELEFDEYANEKIYSTYNSGSEDWDKGIHYGKDFRQVLQSIKEYQSGGSIPGATGNMYARVGAPSNGPYAKKTLASAQNGGEMSYYQHGLDWKPKGMENGGWLNKYDEAQTGGSWEKQQGRMKAERDKKLKYLLANKPEFKKKTINDKIAERLRQDKTVSTAKDATAVRNYNDADKHSNIARNKTDKEIIAQRKADIAKGNNAKLNQFSTDILDPSNLTRQNMADAASGLGDKFRLFPNDAHSFIDDYLNPAVMIGGMASNLGQAPLQAQQSDSYLPYLTSIGAPLVTGALGGIGAKTTGQFVNNLVNPLAGLEYNPKLFTKLNSELDDMALSKINNYMSKRTSAESLQKELEPYISRVGEPNISREEEVFRNVMGHEYRNAKELENTKFFDQQGNIIENPELNSNSQISENLFGGTSLSDKEKQLFKWFENQFRFDKLPKTENKKSLGVLEDFRTRIETPEGKRRLKELGIHDGDDIKELHNIKIVEDPNTFGYYIGEKNGIAMNPNHPLPRKVTRHEIEHAVQDAISNSRVRKLKNDLQNFKYLFRPKKAAAAKYEALKPTSEIDDMLSGLELRKEGTPGKTWSNTMDDKPIDISEYKPKILDRQNATDYFLTGTSGKEKSAFLSEVQQYMMDRGMIPKTSYVEITPEMIKKTFIDAMNDEVGGGKYLRIFNIMKPSENNYKLISEGLNKMLGIAPIGLGLGAASQIEQKKQGGIIKDDRGQWAHPGKVTEINSNNITMKGVPFTVIGISDEGDVKVMKPGENYKFKGKKVTEYPMAKNGVNQQDEKTLQHLDQLTNFTNYNKPQPGGWLDKYN